MTSAVFVDCEGATDINDQYVVFTYSCASSKTFCTSLRKISDLKTNCVAKSYLSNFTFSFSAKIYENSKKEKVVI